MQSNQELIVWGNFVLFAGLFVLYQVKTGAFSLGSLAILIYTLSAVFGVILYNSSLSFFTNLQIVPALFLFFLFLVIIYPIIRFDNSTIEKISCNYRLVYWLSIFIGLVSIVPSAEITYLLATVSRMDKSVFSEIHTMKNTGDGAINTLQLSAISRPFYFFVYRLSDISPILLFLQFAAPKKDWRIIVLLLLSIYCVNGMGIIQGGRRSITQTALYIIGLYFIFKKFLPINVKKAIRIYGVILLAGIIAVFLFLTFARFTENKFESRGTVIEWISLYAGEGPLNFNKYIWNMHGTTNGDYCFSYFKQLFGLDSFNNNIERRDYWALKTNIPQYIFYTFIGNIIEDFGKFWGGIFLIFVSLILGNLFKMRGRQLKISNLIILCLWANIVLSGITFYAYGGNRAEILLTDLFLAFLCSLNRNNAFIYNKLA